jgi:hypothetical protein
LPMRWRRLPAGHVRSDRLGVEASLGLAGRHRWPAARREKLALAAATEVPSSSSFFFFCEKAKEITSIEFISFTLEYQNSEYRDGVFEQRSSRIGIWNFHPYPYNSGFHSFYVSF